VEISTLSSFRIGYSLSQSPAKLLVLWWLIFVISSAPSSNAIIIFGVLGGLIGDVSFCFGKENVLVIGSLHAVRKIDADLGLRPLDPGFSRFVDLVLS
jgi:hypothetical protein